MKKVINLVWEINENAEILVVPLLPTKLDGHLNRATQMLFGDSLSIETVALVLLL